MEVSSRQANVFGITSWVGLVGLPVDLAVEVIRRRRPDLDVEKVRFGSRVTEGFRTDRVRVFYSNNGNVVIEPIIG